MLGPLNHFLAVLDAKIGSGGAKIPHTKGQIVLILLIYCNFNDFSFSRRLKNHFGGRISLTVIEKLGNRGRGPFCLTVF